MVSLRSLLALGGQLTWAEVSGSLGDLGTFLPLLIALVKKVNLDLGTTLITTGLYNIVSGVQFGIPMCVQPMKTIAAVALSASQPSLTLPQILHAGLFVSICVLLLGLTRLVDIFNWLVPQPVVRGVQLGVGIKLAMKGVDMALRQLSMTGSVSSMEWRPVLGSEGLLVAAVALLGLLVTSLPVQAFQPGDPDAAEDGGLGPRPTDTPFEPLLCCLTKIGAVATSTTTARDGQEEEGGSGCDSETSRLLGSSHPDGGSNSGSSGRSNRVPAAADAELPSVSIGNGGIVNSPADVTARSGRSNNTCGGCSHRRTYPSALVAVLVGMLMAAITKPQVLRELKLGPSIPRLLRPSWSDLRAGVFRAGLPQLPLTTLNSVIAVSHLADSLFPRREDARRWRPAAVSVSVGLMNLVGCWLGAMPCCHGAGGLAAQYKFGARGGAACVVLGGMKTTLGLLFGSSVAGLLAAFPQPLLGALLTLAGVELAMSVQHTRTARGYCFALLTAAAILGLNDTGTGFLIGWGAVTIVALCDAAGAALQRCGLGNKRQAAAAAASLGDSGSCVDHDGEGRKALGTLQRWYLGWGWFGASLRPPAVAVERNGLGGRGGGAGSVGRGVVSAGHLAYMHALYDRLEEIDLGHNEVQPRQ